ncbi:MAG: Cu(I)/Ag(I) efflux system membrane protein CusA/SilA [Verrucomicrobiales bacterium]|jgi:Cu(I)/Ag(I) efflux system membrane protein CusA/SilA
MIDKLIEFTLRFKPVVVILLILLVGAGVFMAPFDWEIPGVERSPVAVDAIPDIGENQQIVFTEWPGSSPQDIEDQVTYPLTAALLGIPKVKTIRSFSNFGFSTIYVIFDDSADWDWSRTKLDEKLNSLPRGSLPDSVQPTLGPDATGLGQVFWYTLEGRDPDGNVTAGWTLQELRSIQDYYVRYGIQAARGVAEVSSVGGFQKEYQIDVDPDSMRAYGVTLEQVFRAVQESNVDVGARTIEINKVEYVVRGRGFLRSLDDLRQVVVSVRDNTPVTLRQIASIEMGPAMRRGVLDKAGAEAVGGVVVARYGANPMEVIKNAKAKIKEIQTSLPRKTLEDGTETQVTIVPFYDRTGLIDETLETLNTALVDEILITIIVVLLLVFHLRASAVISLMLPLAVLFTFIAMWVFDVTANVVALAGIAIAIGTIVDMGIVICENILKRAETPEGREEGMFRSVLHSTKEVGGAVLTAILTTIVGFLPVFFLLGAEGKLYRPLAFTKTFALIAAVFIALVIIPPLAQQLLKPTKRKIARWPALVLALIAAVILAFHWNPLDAIAGSLVFVVVLIGGLLLAVHGFMRVYERVLRFFLRTKGLLLALVACVAVAGVGAFYSLEREFRPALDEGSFLYMPSTMPHASIGESLDALQIQDRAIRAIPEVDEVVGKIGRVDSSLDPAPIAMVETIISYKPEWGHDENGERVRLWRDHIKTSQDIWDEIVEAAAVPGSTLATKLQPIETRLLMLQTGMRAELGIKVFGPDLESIEQGALQIEAALKNAPAIDGSMVLADRVVGKPYLEIDIDRAAIARYGISIKSVQNVISVAVGGQTLTTTVEGRERYAVRVRYQRERRDSIEELSQILVQTPTGTQIPLGQLSTVNYVRGPQVIKSEDARLVAYVTFAQHEGIGPVNAIEETSTFLDALQASGELELPQGVSYEFTGAYQSFLETQRMLLIVGSVALLLILIIIYFQLRSILSTLVVWSGVFVAFAGGLILLYLYNQSWFLNVDIFGVDLRSTFQIGPIAMSAAVGVGFLALFGIATDDGVLMGTFIRQQLLARKPADKAAIREAVVIAAVKRNRPAMMTTATTLLALIPVMTSSGRGSDVMLPMAIPTFGGMTIAIFTVFVVPTLLCWIEELKINRLAPKITE